MVIISLLIWITVYWLPGFCLLFLFELKGISKWARFLFLPLILSFILIPYCSVAVANIRRFVPTPATALITSFGFALIAVFLQLTNRRIKLDFLTDSRSHSSREWVIIFILILGYAFLINIPRMDMLVHGDQANAVRPGDEDLYLANITSVARTGIPPRYHANPDFDLVFYYWGFIQNAMVSNQDLTHISLASSRAIHGIFQVSVFLLLAYYILRRELKTRFASVIGLAFLAMGLGAFGWKS